MKLTALKKAAENEDLLNARVHAGSAPASDPKADTDNDGEGLPLERVRQNGAIGILREKVAETSRKALESYTNLKQKIDANTTSENPVWEHLLQVCETLRQKNAM